MSDLTKTYKGLQVLGLPEDMAVGFIAALQIVRMDPGLASKLTRAVRELPPPVHLHAGLKAMFTEEVVLAESS